MGKSSASWHEVHSWLAHNGRTRDDRPVSHGGERTSLQPFRSPRLAPSATAKKARAADENASAYGGRPFAILQRTRGLKGAANQFFYILQPDAFWIWCVATYRIPKSHSEVASGSMQRCCTHISFFSADCLRRLINGRHGANMQPKSAVLRRTTVSVCLSRESAAATLALQPRRI